MKVSSFSIRKQIIGTIVLCLLFILSSCKSSHLIDAFEFQLYDQGLITSDTCIVKGVIFGERQLGVSIKHLDKNNESIKIRGYLYDEKNNESIKYARVSLVEKKQNQQGYSIIKELCKSDGYGNFIIDAENKQSDQKVLIAISAVGYQTCIYVLKE